MHDRTDAPPTPTVTLRVDDLTSPAVCGLVARHLDGMQAETPAGQVHALGMERLRGAEVTFWSAWVGDALVGCGALRRLDDTRGELKSMRVTDPWRGKGVGRAILTHIVDHARALGLRSLWLETGEPFVDARRLYERAGFRYCGAFGDYTEGGFGVFMTLDLEAGGRP